MYYVYRNGHTKVLDKKGIEKFGKLNKIFFKGFQKLAKN